MGKYLWDSEVILELSKTAIVLGMGMVPGAGLLLVAYLTKAVGYGDGLVLLMLGIMVGMRRAVLVFAVALFLAAICSVVFLMLRKVHRNSRLPFLPFLAASWFLVGITG